MKLWLCLGQGSQCFVLLKKLHPSAVFSAYFPYALLMQKLDNLCVTHQSQVTRHVLSYGATLFRDCSGETFHSSKRFAVVQEETPCSRRIFYPSNPHAFGNECHTACCALSEILFVVELVEVKAHPRQSGPLDFDGLGGKTVVLLLHVIKIYFDTGAYIILYYGLCVLKGFIELRKKGVFACDILKKRR